MDVVLLRHAQAQQIAASDHLRLLTPQGKDQAREIGKRLRWYDCGFRSVLASPALRTAETASIVVDVLADAEVTPDDRLALDSSQAHLDEIVAFIWSNRSTLVVSHQPVLSKLVGVLLPSAAAPLRPAESLRIRDGELVWRFAWDDEAPRRGLSLSR